MNIKGHLIILCIFGVSLVSTQALDQQFLSTRQQFAFNLYTNISDNKNVLVSPISVDYILNLLLLGSDKSTFTAIRKTLFYPANYNSTIIENNLQKWTASIKSVKNVELATKLYVNKTLTLKNSFSRSTKKSLNAEVESIEFVKVKKAVMRMNAWIAKKTKNLIKNVIDDSLVNKVTKMIGINTIYFYAEWQTPFDDFRTFDGIFTTENSQKVFKKLMTMKINVLYSNSVRELGGASVVDLKFKNPSSSMLFILPPENKTMKSWIQSIKSVDWGVIDKALNFTYTNVTIPRFNFTYEINLKDSLKNMGLSEIFEGEPNFSKMLEGKQKPCVNTIIHKTVISVNETGTEAAGVTLAGDGGALPPMRKNPEFIANRPFFFVIRSTFNILFMGQFMG